MPWPLINCEFFCSQTRTPQWIQQIIMISITLPTTQPAPRRFAIPIFTLKKITQYEQVTELHPWDFCTHIPHVGQRQSKFPQASFLTQLLNIANSALSQAFQNSEYSCHDKGPLFSLIRNGSILMQSQIAIFS